MSSKTLPEHGTARPRYETAARHWTYSNVRDRQKNTFSSTEKAFLTTPPGAHQIFPQTQEGTLYSRPKAPPILVRRVRSRVLEKGGLCPRWISQRYFYFNRSSIISMVETFRASWPSPTISVPKFTCFDKPPWKKRLFTTSATSTAVLMALPRAFRVSFLAPVL